MLFQHVIRISNEDRARSKFKRRIRKRFIPKIKNIVWKRLYGFIYNDPEEAEFFEELNKMDYNPPTSNEDNYHDEENISPNKKQKMKKKVAHIKEKVGKAIEKKKEIKEERKAEK